MSQTEGTEKLNVIYWGQAWCVLGTEKVQCDYNFLGR